MAKGYWVASYREIKDQAALENYSALATSAIEGAGGRFLSRGIAVESHEAGWLERTVIVEFDSVEKAIAAYNTKAYQEAVAAMNHAVERDFRILRGVTENGS